MKHTLALLLAILVGPPDMVHGADSPPAAQKPAGLATAAIFSDHPVLQREAKLPVWGTAKAGQSVSVTFAGQTKSAVAGADGRWRVVLDRLKAGHAGALVVQAATSITVNDVQVGDVWLCAGDAFLSRTVSSVRSARSELASKDLLTVRRFRVDTKVAQEGLQNWTSHFREEFQKRKGYDPLPWLVTMGPIVQNDRHGKRQRTVNSAEQTERFEWDYQDVIASLFYEHGWQPAAEVSRAAGCTLAWEPYRGPFDTVEAAALADLPMGEFWSHTRGGINPAIVGAGRAAGRRVIGAEAFSGMPRNSRRPETPATLKASADAAFVSGVNRLGSITGCINRSTIATSPA